MMTKGNHLLLKVVNRSQMYDQQVYRLGVRVSW